MGKAMFILLLVVTVFFWVLWAKKAGCEDTEVEPAIDTVVFDSVDAELAFSVAVPIEEITIITDDPIVIGGDEGTPCDQDDYCRVEHEDGDMTVYTCKIHTPEPIVFESDDIVWIDADTEVTWESTDSWLDPNNFFTTDPNLIVTLVDWDKPTDISFGCSRESELIFTWDGEKFDVIYDANDITGAAKTFFDYLEPYLNAHIKDAAEKLNEPQPRDTDIIVILDRSGSMETMKFDMLGGLWQFVKDQKAVKGNAYFTLVQFNSEWELVYDSVNIQEVDVLELEPRGNTALLDAIGLTFARLYSVHRNQICVIITDGLENASTEFTKADIVSMIEAREKLGWKFIYLGANQDAIQEGVGLGITWQNCTTFDVSNVSGTIDTMSTTVTSFRTD